VEMEIDCCYGMSISSHDVNQGVLTLASNVGCLEDW
jgi:hypothetical protein